MIAIIGAGISGLSLAWHLQQKGKEYVLLEAQKDAGGYIKTLKLNDCMLELGPNSLLADQEVLDFIKTTGLDHLLVPSNAISKSRYILKKGKYRKLPSSPPDLLFNNFFSWKSKRAVLSEPLKPAADIPDESLSAFFRRRFNQEIVDYALTPFVSGIYAGDPDKLLLEETFPFLKEAEMNYGSVLKGFIKNKPARKQSYTFKEGMQMFPVELSKKLSNFLPEHQVISAVKKDRQYLLKVKHKDETKEITCDKLVVTGPAFKIDFLAGLYPELISSASSVDYPPIAIIHSVYPKRNVHHPLNGFGGLNPAVENTLASGHIWNSSVFEHRCPQDKVLFTSFIGGSLNSDKARLNEEELKKGIHKDLAKHFRIEGVPDFQHYHFYSHSIPQYTSGIKKVKDLASTLEKENIFFCTNWINGISLSDCIKKGKTLSDKFLD